MNSQLKPDPAGFDSYAGNYDEALNQALSATGEDKTFYAAGRVAHVAKLLGQTPRRVLDFGCGTGTAAPYLRDLLGATRIVGIDPSAESIRVARATHPEDAFVFLESKDFTPAGEIDAAYCNGVFHHIPVAERLEAARSVFAALRPGGHFALWENNPWNPGTVYVMSRCAFDRDAITLSPPETARLLRDAGFEIVRTDYLFFFPKPLSFFRPLEQYLRALPLGGQYLVLGRKPAATA